MHDLQTIIALNAVAGTAQLTGQQPAAKDVDLESGLLGVIASLRRQGRFVVVEYEGLHLTRAESFGEEHLALAAFNAPVTVGQHRAFYAPAGTPHLTLGDYYASKAETPSADVNPENPAAIGTR